MKALKLTAILILFFVNSGIINSQIRYTLIPESPQPGEPVTVAIDTNVKEALLIVNGRQLGKASFFSIPAQQPTTREIIAQWLKGKGSASLPRYPGFYAAIITIPSTVEAESAIIRLNNEDRTLYEIPVNITPREFRSQTLRLNNALTNLVTDQSPQRTAESQRLWEILTTTGDKLYHSDSFVLPVTSTRRTSQFGTRRVNQYSDGRRVTSIHAGVDFGIPTGTEVFACGRGMVALARHRIISGYSVIIEHAPAVYSIYYHLDSILAQEGEIVETGQVIGLSGSTGFSTGPHLHWELRVNTENTDPDAFISRSVIDKNLIISKLYNIEIKD